MLGLVMSVITVVVPTTVALPAALPSAPAAGFICDPSPSAACDPAPAADAHDADGLQYATEAVIDCPTPAAGALGENVAGECDGTVRDASYRASRDPESERLPGSLRPARRDRSVPGMRAACAGVPVEGHDGLSSPNPTQPLALFAVPALQTFASSRFSFDSPAALPSRGIRPLERPPRI